MRARSTSGVAVAILVMGITSGGNAASFQFTAIDVPGASLIQPEGLNDDGQIVGAFTQNSTNDGFLLNNGHLTTINVPNAFTAALGINALGQIVGYYDANMGTANPQGFLLNSGVFSTLDVPSAYATEANAINDSGTIVGQYFSNVGNSGSVQGFVLSGGIFHTVDFPGAVWTGAKGINNAGEIVGFYTDAQDNDHSFLYGGDVFSEIVVPGCTSSAAFGINNYGAIVGSCLNGQGVTEAYLDNLGDFTLFSFIASDTEAHSINDSGQIVGFSFTSPSESLGFLATPVSEPGSLALVVSGIMVMSVWRWRRRPRRSLNG